MFGIAGSHLGGSAVALGKVCVLHAQVYFPNSVSLFDNWIARNPVINPHVLIEIDILDMPYLLGNSIWPVSTGTCNWPYANEVFWCILRKTTNQSL